MKNQIGKPPLAAILAIFVLLLAPSTFQAQAADNGRPRVALVLSGGGALGIAHVGVIKVLEELGIYPDIVVGTSMGAIVGGLYAMGYSPDEMESIVFETDWVDLFTDNGEAADEAYYKRVEKSRYFGNARFDQKGFIVSGGLLSGRKILHRMDCLSLSIPSPADFDALPRRFRAVSVDVATGKTVVHSDGSVADAMRASMSIPGVFAPYNLSGQYLVDGGVVDNMPVDIARGLGADLIIAVDLANLETFDPESFTRTPLAALGRSLDIFIRNTVVPQIPHADLVITVDTQGFSPADFAKAREINALGERTARANAAGIAEFAKKANSGRKANAIGRVPMSRVSSVVIEGGNAADRARARALYEPLVGTAPSPETMGKLFGALDANGRYEFIRVRVDSSRPEATLVVSLMPREIEPFAFRASFEYDATYSRYLNGNLRLCPGVSFRGMPFENSRISIDAEVLDTPAFEASFAQPFLDRFSFSLFYSARRDFDTWLADSAPEYRERSESMTTGFRLSAEPSAGYEISLGWSRDWIGDENLVGIRSGETVDAASCLHADFSVRRCDSPVFPASGVTADFRYLASLPIIGSERLFSTFETEGGAFFPSGDALSVGLRWIAGTDFSPSADDGRAASAHYKPNLTSRHLFPGLLTAQERIGSHVVGGGIALQYAVNSGTTSRNFPLCILLQASAGTIFDDGNDLSLDVEAIHATIAAGAGIRLGDSFGVSLRGGVCRNTGGTGLPFIALDLGAIGY